MKKNITLSMIATVALVSLVGCGDSNNTTTGWYNASKSGTGYYVDAPVKGLKYVCGKYSGITDADGKFTFEKGKPCTFKIGEIEIDEVEPTKLKDEAKIVVEDVQTAQFLQSLDDPSDGTITITPQIVEVLEEQNIESVPEEDKDLQELVKTIEESAKEDENFTFTGGYVTETEATEHLEGTKGQVAAEGAKFTFPSKFYSDIQKDTNYYDGKEHEQFGAELFEFTADKKFKHHELVFEEGAFVLDENNNNNNDTEYVFENGKWVEDNDDKPITTVVSENDTVVTLNELYQLTIKSIKDLKDKNITLKDSNLAVTMPEGAQEIQFGFKVLKEYYGIYEKARTHGHTENDYYLSLSEVLENQCGERYFSHAKEDSGVKGIAFTCGEETQTSGTLVGVKNDHTLVTSGVGTWEIKTLPNSDIKALVINVNAKYKKHSDSRLFAMKDGVVWEGNRDSVGEQEPMVTYNQTAMDAVSTKLQELASGGSGTQTQTDITKELLAGKTFYVVGSDDGEVKLFKLVINNEATSMNVYTLDGTPIEKNVAIQIVPCLSIKEE